MAEEEEEVAGEVTKEEEVGQAEVEKEPDQIRNKEDKFVIPPYDLTQTQFAFSTRLETTEQRRVSVLRMRIIKEQEQLLSS